MRCSHFWVWGRVVSVPENVLSDTHWGDSNCIGRSCCANFFGFGVGFGSVPQKGWSDTRWGNSNCIGRTCGAHIFGFGVGL